MFNNLREEIINLNSDVKNVANSERAVKLRKKLLTIGLTLCIIGFVGAFVCFTLFVTAGMHGFSENGFSARILVPFILFLPFGALGGIGSKISSLGFKIIVTGYTANLIDDTVGNCCPKCGDIIEDNEIFCSKCGTKTCKECSKCKHINSIKSNFCKKCGKQLDE